MTDRASLVLAQAMVGEQAAWAHVPVGQYSAGTTRVSVPSFPRGQSIAPAAAAQTRPPPQSQVFCGFGD